MRILLIAVLGLTGILSSANEYPQTLTAEKVALTGKVSGAGAEFKLNITLRTEKAEIVPLMGGDFSGLPGEKISSSSVSFWRLSPRGKLFIKDGWLMLECSGAGIYSIEYPFASKVTQTGVRRSCNLQIITPLIGTAAIEMGDNSINPELTGSITTGSSEKLFEAAFSKGEISFSWEQALSTEQQKEMLSYDIYSAVSVQAGSVKILTNLLAKVHQGKIQELKIAVPDNMNILSVSSPKPISWELAENGKILEVKLSKESEDTVELNINAEKSLAQIPCEFELSSLLPTDAIRINGRLAVGSGPGLKTNITASTGVIQTGAVALPLPKASMPANPIFYTFTDDYQMTIEASNVTPTYNAETTCVYDVRDNTLQVRMDCVLEIRDAPLKEIEVNFPDNLTFSRVVSNYIKNQDYDLRTVDGQPRVRLQFSTEASGTVSFSLYFERELKKEKSFTASPFQIIGSRSLRGSLILAAERGLLLNAGDTQSLIPVHPGTLPERHAGLQAAFLFKSANATTVVTITEVERHITGECFHLLSVGEGTAYGSTLFSLHIAGAPAGKLRFLAHDSLKNLDFRGRNLSARRQIEKTIDGFTVWEIEFSKRQLGDITVLAVYEIAVRNGEKVRIGAVTSDDAPSSVGWIALTGPPGIKVKTLEAASGTALIDTAELPAEYYNMLTNQLFAVYRGSGKTQWQDVEISSFDKDLLPSSVIDWSEISTRIDNNGASITDISYRVKNSTAQFLNLKLPPDSELWNVRVDGKRMRLSLDNDQLMIPLPRHQNINSPIDIAVSYAIQLPPLGNGWDIELQSPAVQGKVMFSKWHVSVPENCAIIESEPHFSDRKDIFRGGAAGLAKRLINGVIALWPIMLTALAVTVTGCLAITGIARKRVVTAIFWSLVTLVFFSGLFLSRDHIKKYFRSRSFATNQVTFTDLARFNESPQRIQLKIDNMDAMHFNWLAGTTITGGIALLITAFITRKRNPEIIKILLIGIGAALCLSGFAQWYRLGIILSTAIVLLLPLLIPLGVWLRLWRKLSSAKVVLLLIFFTVFSVKASELPIITSYKMNCELNEKSVVVISEYNFDVKKAGTAFIADTETAFQKIKTSDNCRINKNDHGWEIFFSEPGKYHVKTESVIALTLGDRKKTFNIYAPPAVNGIIELQTSSGTELRARDAVTIIADENGCSKVYPKASGQNINFEVIAAQITDTVGGFSAATTLELNPGRGAIELTGTIALIIPQGATKVFNINVPENMQIADIEATGLETWYFDRVGNLLSIYFQEPQTGSKSIAIKAQIPLKSLPQTVVVKNFIVDGASQQHGTLGIFGNSEIRTAETPIIGFTAINNSYFKSTLTRAEEPLRAYRYSGIGAELKMEIDEVKPEIRVDENVQVSFDDERVVLSSQLKLDIIKGGIFVTELQIPEGMEINTITGNDIQHWNEIRKDRQRRAVINFKRRISDSTTIKCELFKIASSYKEEKVPSLTLKDVDKHRGTLTVSAVKGITMRVLLRNGIAAAQDIADIPRGGSRLQFRIQQPDWTLRLGFEQTQPWIQAQTLQTVKMRPNSITGETTIIYAIENNGLRQLNLELPDEFIEPEFDGRFITSINKLDHNRWRIELDRKIEHQYRLKINSRMKTRKDGTTMLKPVKIIDSGVQNGYVAVFPEDSLALKPPAINGEISDQNPRSIPDKFGDRNLSEAVAAFRTLGDKWSISLSVQENKPAQLLKASLNALNLSTLVTFKGEMITEVTARVKNSGETFLKFQLPEGAAMLGARVDSIPAETVRAEADFMIPLPRITGTISDQTVCFSYILSGNPIAGSSEHTFVGPAFHLPIKNISWKLYLPDNFSYSSFEGNLDFRGGLIRDFGLSTLKDYDSLVSTRIAQKSGKIKEYMASGKSYSTKGFNHEARQMMQNAIDISEDQALRSDLQGQLLGYNREWNFENIAKRRNKLARSRNRQSAPVAESNFAEQIRQQQGDEEITVLRQIADRIFIQQQAAYSTPQLFDIEIPWSGKQLTFERAIDTGSGNPLSIKLISAQKYRYDLTQWVGLPIMILLCIMVSALYTKPSGS